MPNRILTTAVAAALVAPVAVWAQSTVVLYGLVDVGYQNVSKYTAPGTSAGSKSGFGSGGARSSRLGARATEDLGGGLSARAVIEFDIQGDTGVTPALMTGRQTFVGLAGKSWGELSLGRQTTHSYVNVLLADGIAGGNSFQSFYGLEDQVTRASNYLKYSSPVIGGGFTFGAGWAPGEAVTAATNKNANFWDGHLRWERGPFGIGFAEARTRTKTGAAAAGFSFTSAGALATGVPTAVAAAAATDYNEKDTSLAAYYKFSGWRLFGLHTRSKQSGTGAAENRRLNGARAEVDIGKGILAFSVAKSKNKLIASADSSFWGLGYYHQMTARTQFYATYGRIKNDVGGSMGLNTAFNTLATGGAVQGGGGFVAAGADPRGFQLGMGHSF